MSGKLDQSLDEIMKDRKPTGAARRGKGGRLPARKAATKPRAATIAVIAPSGGVQKNTRAVKLTKARTTLSVSSVTGDSKIAVSNLPEDVTERLIKDYFGSTVSHVKSVTLNYGPTGRSRGNATVVFSKPTAAAEAAKLDGTKVDGKAMRIEVLLGAKNVPAPQAPKPLSERVARPKNAAQEAKKGPAGNAKGTAKVAPAKGGRKDPKKSGRAGRPKAKTTEELDAEMQDYFGGDANGTATNGAAAPVAATNGGDAGMVDEVM